MELTEAQKDELFADFQLRLAELDKSDKRLAVAKNNHAMKGVTNLYHEMCHSGDTADDYLAYKYPGLYYAYLKLRSAIPNIVMLKKVAKVNDGSIPGARLPYRVNQNPVLEDEDMDEATKVGKILLDAVIGYLEEK